MKCIHLQSVAEFDVDEITSIDTHLKTTEDEPQSSSIGDEISLENDIRLKS